MLFYFLYLVWRHIADLPYGFHCLLVVGASTAFRVYPFCFCDQIPIYSLISSFINCMGCYYKASSWVLLLFLYKTHVIRSNIAQILYFVLFFTFLISDDYKTCLLWPTRFVFFVIE